MPKSKWRYCYLFMALNISGMLYGQSLDNLKSSVLFEGNEVTAYRDPLPFYDKEVYYLFFTLTEIEKDGKIYMYTAVSKSRDLVKWSPVQKITPKDASLDYSSPGSIVQYKDEWVMCLQTYPRPGYSLQDGVKFGNENARLFTIRSKDLEHWTEPELLKVKGEEVAEKDMGRMIDPFIMQDQNEKNKWWIFYKQNGASRSFSYDLKHWTYSGHIPAGENVCILPVNNEYIMFHSPENGIGVKRSEDLVNWTDEKELITLGQQQWTWAKGRITAGFVLDRKEHTDYRYLLFFHGSGPKTEKDGDFDKNASIGLAWSKDLVHWNWK